MTLKEKNDAKLMEIFDKYNLNSESREELLKIITPIFSHPEFQKRMTDAYLHHDRITLGEHIIEDTIVTYILSKKYIAKKKNTNFNISLALKISMLHDLYTYPWQNNKNFKSKKIYNKHGFRHPIEAVINASIWYPEIFSNNVEAKIIIEGITHHMFPLPVRRYHISNNNSLELKNFNLTKEMNENLNKILELSSNKRILGPFSFQKKISIEGKLMRKADRRVSYDNFKRSKSIKGILALLTGRNGNLSRS